MGDSIWARWVACEGVEPTRGVEVIMVIMVLGIGQFELDV